MTTVGYCVRVQALEGYADKIRSLSLYQNMIAVKHHGKGKENPHYHMVVRTDLQGQTFRKRLKVLFPDGKGNEHMSIKAWDGDNKALTYLFHEDTEEHKTSVIARCGFTDEQINNLRVACQVFIQSVVIPAKAKSAHLLWEVAYEHFKDIKSDMPSDVDVAHFICLHALRNDKYVPQSWLMKAMVNRVRFLLLNGNLLREERLACQIVESYYPTYS